MSITESEQCRMITFPTFDNQGDTMLHIIQNLSASNHEAMPSNCLQECANGIESEDSGINLPLGSTHSSSNDIHLNHFVDTCKNEDLSNIDFSFMKIANIVLENIEDIQTESKGEIIKHHGLTPCPIISSDSEVANATIQCPNHIPNCNTSECKTLDCNTATDNTSDSFMCGTNISINGATRDGDHLDGTLGVKTDYCVAQSNTAIVNMHESDNGKCDFQSGCTTLPIHKEDAFNNLNIVDKQIKACEQCSMTFRYKRHLDRHLEGHQKNNCTHCNAKFARRKHLEAHLFRAHGERITKYPHSCDLCSRSFPKRILLNRHRAKHEYENGRVCSECGEMLKAGIDDKEHKENHCLKKNFKCNRCLQTFSIEQTYLSHIQNHDNHKCTECDVSFASKKKAHEHFKLAHSTKSDNSKVRNGVYFCADCRHTFFKKDDYFRHLESVSHLNKVNREIPIRPMFACMICSKKLISQRALDQHIRRIHKGEKRFTCNIYGCTFQCARRTDLDRHKQLHVEERNIVCEHCGKTFTSVSILNDHVLYVHNKERQFICEECGKAFKRNSLLKRHKLSHQQHRPFACVQCNTAFKRSHHLTRHLETCHRITLEKKKKVVKLMKTADGNLVPVPEKPKKLRSKDPKVKEADLKPKLGTKIQSPTINTEIDMLNSDLEFQSAFNPTETTNLSTGLTSLLHSPDMIPQVLSLVDVTSGQVVTVEVASPEAIPMNDLIDQFENNCNEILSLPSYQDLEFQNGILSADQNYYDHASYAELENVEVTPLSLDANTTKIDTLPAMESYLSQSFPAFLNL